MVTVNLGMLHYVLDHVYGAVLHRTKITPPFFSRGWGGNKLELFERMINQLFPNVEGQNWPPMLVEPIWKIVWESKAACLKEGVFKTPCDEELLSALPTESHHGRVAFLAPKFVSPHRMSCVVHLAGTGDHTFERRLRLGGPLLKENIATMVLESPFYGKRRPFLQRGAKLLCVSDLLLLGRVTIEEARSLLYWLDSEAGFGKMGVCGISMGSRQNSTVPRDEDKKESDRREGLLAQVPRDPAGPVYQGDIMDSAERCAEIVVSGGAGQSSFIRSARGVRGVRGVRGHYPWLRLVE
ncbi:protein ABHD18-like [Coffea eugenioides]|uniref:protein ABHD18-like n=1 Tax=Coffea eugenioides TaxID=49369 RepID=UPI000F611E84|nr:protein ABHD18-like [Coffea eugenioides]